MPSNFLRLNFGSFTLLVVRIPSGTDEGVGEARALSLDYE